MCSLVFLAELEALLEQHREGPRTGNQNKYSISPTTVGGRREPLTYNDRHKPLNRSTIPAASRECRDFYNTFSSGNVCLSPEEQTGCAVNIEPRPHPPRSHHRKASGLDNLALAALTSPPSI